MRAVLILCVFLPNLLALTCYQGTNSTITQTQCIARVFFCQTITPSDGGELSYNCANGGICTHDNIIRPIAFRPVGNQVADESRRQSHDSRVDRHVIRGDLAKSASNLYNVSASNSHLNRPRPMFQASTRVAPVQ